MNFKNILYIFFVIFSISCSKDEETVKSFSDLTISTTQPIFGTTNFVIKTGGVLSFVPKVSYEIGICYNTSGNPNIINDIARSNDYDVTSFNSEISNFDLGKTYYIKAYVKDLSSGEVKYGNELTCQTPALTTNLVKNISVTGFSVLINVSSDLSNNSERGICYSTSQNPTVSNRHFADNTAGSGNYTISLDGQSYLSDYYVFPNTTYYLRSYVRVNSTYYYGNEVSFKSAGYIGGSGGYVFFDKGETTNGWRYLEAAPSELTTSSFYYFKWGNSTCGYSFISGLGNAIGDGANNTTLIKNYCNYNNIAATMCRVTSLNGLTDWFLPSLDEAKELYKLKYTKLVSFSSGFLTSSQSSNTLCFAINSSGSSYTTDKFNSGVAWQVRKF